jgi:hypothetical protein
MMVRSHSSPIAPETNIKLSRSPTTEKVYDYISKESAII